MLLLRLAALLQVSFLPGYLLVRAAGMGASGALQVALFSFASSLVLNWILVYVLTAAGMYLPGVLYVLFAAECLWFVRLNWGQRLSGATFRRAGEHLAQASFPYAVALLGALGVVAVLAVPAFLNRNAVLTEWDGVVSWNRWALDWADNRLPRLAWRYPQLLPANWSLLYVFSGDQVVQGPVRVLQSLFPLGIAATLLDAGLRRGSARLLAAVPVLGAILLLYPYPLTGGYADLPVAFFGFLAVVTAYYGDGAERSWWAALFFACGAALTKQAGLFVLVFVWVSALATFRQRTFAVRSAALVLALVGSWYLPKEVQIRLGREASELSAVMVEAHGGRGALDRLRRALQYVFGAGLGSRIAVSGALVLMASSLRDPRQRRIVLGLVTPYFLIWAFLYSYDARNATLVLPFVALSVVSGFTWPSRWVPTRLQAIAAAVGLVGLAGFVGYREQAVRESQLAQQRALGDPALNAAIYRAFEENPIRGKVCTSYQIFGFLPGFRGRMVVAERLSLEGLGAMERDAEVAYVMHARETMAPDAWSTVESRLRDGRYRLLFEQPSSYGTFRLVQIRP